MSKALPPLWLDYQRLPPGRRLPGLVLLIVGLGLAGGLLLLSLDVSSELASTEEHLAKLKQAAEHQRFSAGATGALPEDKAGGLPPGTPASRWESLLAALETANDDAVTLLSLTPGEREIVITGEAKDLGAALDYARRLQNAPAIAQAYLAKHEVVREHPQRPVRFTLLAAWREAAK